MLARHRPTSCSTCSPNVKNATVAKRCSGRPHHTRSRRVHRRDHENGSFGAVWAKEVGQIATIKEGIVIVIVAANTVTAADGRVPNRQVAGFVGMERLPRRSSYVTSRTLRANTRPSFGRRRTGRLRAIDEINSDIYHGDSPHGFGNPLSCS